MPSPKFMGAILLALGLATIERAAAETVRDLAAVQGVRTNQLVGYGLVVGLDGTGDQTSQAPFTVQSIKNMLARFGVTIPPNVNPQLKNVAAVSVHAELPPFIKPGQRIDVTVSSIGNAGSLRGGSLLMTPLRGADGEVYAIAQGSMVVSGFGVSGKDGSRIALNVPTSRRPAGWPRPSMPGMERARLPQTMRCRYGLPRRPMSISASRMSRRSRNWMSSPAIRRRG
jgi:flagellar P-ring protein precursor FlgI